MTEIPNQCIRLLYFADGATWERDDPYRFAPAVSDLDLHLLAEGTPEERSTP